jgi:indole-3-glycerol phosphate synthase
MTQHDLLDRIVSTARGAVASRQQSRPRAIVEREAADRTPRADAFRAALSVSQRVNVIAECKRRSPVNGVLREDYDPSHLAQSYEAGGAAAISVLTEPSFFDGALEHLTRVRASVALPVLRKDFLVDEYQIPEARAAGADAVLLIVAVLGDRLELLVRAADRFGLAALVEVHDGNELRRAVDAGARIIGVNSRDLRTMTVRPATCAHLAPRMPAGITAVAESGIRTGEDVAHLRAVGYSAFLVGERLVRSVDPGASLRELIDASGAASTKHQAPHQARSTKH